MWLNYMKTVSVSQAITVKKEERDVSFIIENFALRGVL